MHYDAFISYSSSDLPWGEKLAADLRDANLDVFFDKSRLQVGKEWEPQLGEALRNSRHAVVLWSNNAKQSDWVQQEAYRFAEISRQAASSLKAVRAVAASINGH